MERKEATERIKEILRRSSDFHNVYTPFELCDEMIDKIPELNSEINILVMFNLEFLWILRERFGKEKMKNIWFLTPDELKRKAAIGIGVDENKVVKYSYNTKQIEGEEKMPKFDVVILNPPYKGSLYVKFLNIAYDISKQYIVAVHPGTIYFNSKENKKQNAELEFKEKTKGHLKEISLFNSRMYFAQIALWVPMTVTYIDKLNNYDNIIVNDKIQNKEYKYFNLSDINTYGNIKEYYSLKENILKFCKNNDNMQKHMNYAFYLKQQKISPYYINLSQLRGHSCTNGDKLVDDDFYTFIPRDTKIEKNISKQLYFCFDIKNEANNFIKYLKTNFARFCLSIYKINMNQGRGELKSIPWLDFSQEWIDEKLYKYFDLTPDEINFIETNIPKYY